MGFCRHQQVKKSLKVTETAELKLDLDVVMGHHHQVLTSDDKNGYCLHHCSTLMLIVEMLIYFLQNVQFLNTMLNVFMTTKLEPEIWYNLCL